MILYYICNDFTTQENMDTFCQTNILCFLCRFTYFANLRQIYIEWGNFEHIAFNKFNKISATDSAHMLIICMNHLPRKKLNIFIIIQILQFYGMINDTKNTISREIHLINVICFKLTMNVFFV